MEFQEVVGRRRMVRTFTSVPVAEDAVQRILRNATRGPSAGFSQGQEFLVLRDAELARFWELGAAWVHESVTAAPLVIVPFAVKDAYLDRYAKPDKGWTDRDEAHWPVPYWYIDTGMAALLMLQTVVDEGLGALFFGIDPREVDGFLSAFVVPAGFEPIGGIAIGHPASGGDPVKSSVHSLSRRSPEEVIHYGSW
jgi:nitroreductase